VRGELWQTRCDWNISQVTSFKQQANCFFLLLLLLLLLLMPELRSTYGPQTACDMWSLPQDVTIATDPLGLEEWFSLCDAGAGAQLRSDGRGCRGCGTLSLINILYGPPGLWRWPAERRKSVQLIGSLHTVPPLTIKLPTWTLIISIYRHVKSV